MTDFYEFLAQSRRITLPDTHTMLGMAGVSLDVPNEEDTERLLNKVRKRKAPMTGPVKASSSPSYRSRRHGGPPSILDLQLL